MLGTRRRRTATGAAIAATVAVPLILGPQPVYADPGVENMTPAEAIAAKVDGELLSTLEAEGTTEFWIRLDSDADLSTAYEAEGKTAKGTAVYEAKTAHAEQTQAELKSFLSDSGVDYKGFWIVNTIAVSGDLDLVGDLAVRTDVAEILPQQEIPLIEVEPGEDLPAVNNVEWGIDAINAPQVWSEFGVTGEDIVIANIDTGVQFDHPALVDQYRGNNGDGTFTHDYNFYDVAEACGDTVACDTNGHGTHTMGTMVGDDGDGNQIGVAPGATWIGTNGCCDSDFTLLSSGEWIIAPTDSNGENPDPSKAADIVNNSWGTTQPVYDPFYEEIVEAWIAAGIFPAFSNGNSGPSCDTTGSPGLYDTSYSTGAFDINGDIASFSGRGPGLDGNVKPDIAAPGVNTRSAVPGDGYGSKSGTSMASPHTAGVVGLMWSAAPALRGDVAGTIEILNTTAIDTEDLQCGGTAENNNVFGEGKLDAFAAVSASPADGVGSLNGAVTSDGEPVSGVAISADSDDFSRSTTTDADGSYSFGSLLPGEYAVTAAKFGYIAQTVTVTVAEDETVTADFALEPAPAGDIAGVVTDGGGHGYPLYAKVTADDTGVSTYTDPLTGAYALDLPEGDYSLTVESVYPGYVDGTLDATTGGTADVALSVEASCLAPGYELDFGNLPGIEGFDDETVPEGWTVVDNGDVAGWTFDNPKDRANQTGGEGNFAVADSDAAGSGSGLMDTELISPVYDLTELSTPGMSFASDYSDLGSSEAAVFITVDGGETWEEVWGTETSLRGPSTVEVDLTAYADATAAQFKFWYTDAGSWAWYWQVDDFQLGLPDCVAIEGGLVIGQTEDANTGTSLENVTVTDTVSGNSGVSAATPDDENLADGFFWLFTTELGEHEFTASRNGWSDETVVVDVVESGVVSVDFTLGAGRLEVSTTQINTTVTMDGSWTEEIELSNTGSAPVTVEVGESGGSFTPMSGQESTQIPLSSPADKTAFSADGAPAAAPTSTHGYGPDDEWSSAASYPSAVFDAASATHAGVTYVVAGVAGSSLSDAVYAYDAAADEWTEKAPLPEALELPTATFVDGLLYVYGGTTGTTADSLYIYDPADDEWTEGSSGPAARWAAGAATVGGQLYIIGGCIDGDCASSSDVQRYDPASDSWEVLSNYPEETAYVACGGIGSSLVCAGGYGDQTSASTYVYNVTTDAWTEAAQMPTDVWGAAYAVANGMLIVSNGAADGSMVITNATYAYDLDTDAWTELAPSGDARYRTTGACGFVKIGGRQEGNAPTQDVEILAGYDDCTAGAGDVPWLSTNQETVTIEPGESVTLEVTTSAAAEDGAVQPGTYSGALTLSANTPYGAVTVDVTMTVAPGAGTGKMQGTVTGINCDGTSVPVAGAQVQVRGPDGTRYDLTTDANGYFSYWFDGGQYIVIVSKDGWAADYGDATVTAGRSVTANFDVAALGCSSGLSQIV
ncbi:MAG TPA: S8 family serine peptidase [Candidatus Stackebrandtia excrementipullorum]|nr:S8 family serine peptidase [Candidatus Stackebrandtia excrementipullorum]